jgi:adenylyl-sulfate kinase
MKYQTMLLEGDTVRHGLCRDLGFSAQDRNENIRRVGEVAKLFYISGKIAICTFISPFAKDRDFVRSLVPEGYFWEIYVKCPIEICKSRDPNGLYKKALAGEIAEFTGITSPYEEPLNPEITVETDIQGVEDIIENIMHRLADKRIIKP